MSRILVDGVSVRLSSARVIRFIGSAPQLVCKRVMIHVQNGLQTLQQISEHSVTEINLFTTYNLPFITDNRVRFSRRVQSL